MSRKAASRVVERQNVRVQGEEAKPLLELDFCEPLQEPQDPRPSRPEGRTPATIKAAIIQWLEQKL